MRGSRAIAAWVGVGVLTLGAAGTLALVVSHAVANVGGPESDEIVRTAPESLPDLTVSAPAAAPPVKAETQATPTVTAPLPIEAAETSARVMQEWAAPHMAQVEQAAARYEPNLEVKVAKTSDGVTRTRVALALGPTQPEIVDTLAKKVGYHSNSRATFGNRGRWFLFTATSNDAIGYNMLQGMHGELHREGFTTERVAAIGDRQTGLAWRKGMLQASIGYVEREISTFGASVEQRFVALTISLKGWGRPQTNTPARDSRWAPYQPSWPPEERDPRLRR